MSILSIDELQLESENRATKKRKNDLGNIHSGGAYLRSYKI